MNPQWNEIENELYTAALIALEHLKGIGCGMSDTEVTKILEQALAKARTKRDAH